MQPSRKLTFSTRLVITLGSVGLLPLLIMAGFSLRSVVNIEEAVRVSLAKSSTTVLELIDRNLFERYGDVQAFGLNQTLAAQDDWYKVGAQANPVARAMNGYVKLYGFYPLTLAVDLSGRVIAVNDVDAAGKPVAPPPGTEGRTVQAQARGAAEARAALAQLVRDAEAALAEAGDDLELSGSVRLTWRTKP